LRRIVVIAVAFTALIGATAAYAVINTYQAPIKFSTKKPGTAKKPVPINYTQDIKASGPAGNRTGVLLDIKTKIYGLKVDGKDFPTCTQQTITAAHNDTGCAKKAEAASGYITAILGPSNNFASSAPGQTQCDPALDVWNGGQGKLVFFFVTKPGHVCGGLQTGSTPPYPATYKQVGKSVVVDVPIPKDVDYPVAGLVGSLETEHLLWKSSTAKVHGKTVHSVVSTGCKGKKRPYSVTFKAALPGRPNETKTVSNSAPCS